MHVSIGENHKAYLARLQHVLEHLASERTRLEAELRYVAGQVQHGEAELVSFLQRSYGLDAQHVPFSLDVERGMIVVADAPAASPADMLAAHVAPDAQPPIAARPATAPDPDPEPMPDPDPDPAPIIALPRTRGAADAARLARRKTLPAR